MLRLLKRAYNAIAAFFIALVEHVVQPCVLPLVYKGLVPDFLVRFAVRQGLKDRLMKVTQPTSEAGRTRFMKFVDDLKSRAIAELPQAANDQHYELPPAFYEHCLGDYRKYSCGYWPAGVNTLTQSELASLELLCSRAELKDGQTVLELGCGWGSFVLFAAAKYPGSTFYCVSNSKSQREHIMREAHSRALTNIHPMTADLNDFQAPAEVDRIVTIECLEHMKNYKRLFQRVSTWLKPGGKMFVHIFTHVGQPYHFDDGGWMSKNFFSGGTMPSDDLLLYFQDDLRIDDQWRLDGTHYARTCNEWLRRMDAHKREVLPILAETYPDCKDPNVRFVMWRLFYIACAEMFAFNGGKQWVVSHYRFVNPVA